jgi:hypothetical protein
MTSESQAPERPTLAIETLGHEQILRPQEGERIREAVGVDANGWVTDPADGETRFLQLLNEIVSFYLAKKLELKNDAKQRYALLKMRSKLQAYMEAARSLKHSNYPPPYLPKPWYDQAMAFYDDLEVRFEEQSEGGRKKAIAEWEFVGQCAALFFVSFSLEPTSVTPGGRPETGAFSKFLLAIGRECRKRLIIPGTAYRVLPKHLQTEVFLANESNDRLRDLVTKALRHQKIYSDAWEAKQGASLYWGGYKEIFQTVCAIDEVGPDEAPIK